MGRKNSVFSHRRLFESSCYKTIDNMPPNSTSQEPLASSAPKFKKNSEDAFEPSKKITERGSISNRFLLKGGHSKVIDSMLSDVTSQESASKDKKRPRDASETRKKRKDKGYYPMMVVLCLLVTCTQNNCPKKILQKRTRPSPKIQIRLFKHVLNRLRMHYIQEKKEKEKDNVTLLIAVKYQAVRRENTRMVSCREYYCYKFQIRSHIQSILFYSRRLLQQYAVDMYIKLETTRLDYCRNNQSELRSEYYQGIVDSINCGETRGHEIGKRIVLPASFIGGPRDMRKRYLDVMALVRRFGKPDLFITMTCNPEWKEIKENLIGSQQPQDRPDLTARVFRSKFQDLKKEVIHNASFRKVSAYAYVVEFQKKGLPHIHMLIILKQEYKINSADQFDDYVSAELPQKENNPRLFNLVVKHMMHGPCGYLNKTNSCMINGQCKSHYPWNFCERTVQGEDGYPIYRRRNDGQTADVRRAKLTNQWVVPYNPYLLMRYDCHINVEVCSGLTVVKYLYKYIYKGHDKVAVHIASGNELTL
ncbi:uncharacterized protein [Henckelia pumila]|uniref:uncharacterized protein isoform X1 n=1 Tax=Henckelia pumila TaxID=405737 RepID=UPI003C6DF790